MGESILFLYSWLASWIAEVHDLYAGMKLFLIGRQRRSRGSSRSKVRSLLASPVSGSLAKTEMKHKLLFLFF